jgi:hypothetical protein
LAGSECTELIGDRHRGHVEVERQEPFVFVAEIAWTSGCDLSLRQLWNGQGSGGERRRRCLGLQLLIFEELDCLRNSVLGDDEVFRGEAFYWVAIFVLHHDGFDYKLRAALEGCGLLRGDGQGEEKECEGSRAHGQNLIRSVV